MSICSLNVTIGWFERPMEIIIFPFCNMALWHYSCPILPMTLYLVCVITMLIM